MKKVVLITLLCAIAFGAFAVWAGTIENTDAVRSTSNIAERSVAQIQPQLNTQAKIGLYGNESYRPLRLDDEVTGDDCSDPFVIGSFPYQDTQDNSGFLDDYNASGELDGPDVVYEFTITECKDVTISLCNSPDNTLDLILLVYGPGDCGGTAIDGDDDGCVTEGFGTPELTSRLDAGTYYFIIDAYTGQTGTYVVDVSVEDCPAPPPYDNCSDVDPADSVLTIGNSLNYVGNNAGATLDSNCDSLTTEMTWIGFTTTELADVTIEFCGTDPVRTGYYRVLSEYCPCDGDNFYFATDENYDDCGDDNPSLYFNRLPAGEWWYPVIAGTDLEGPYDITVTAGPPTGYCEFTCAVGATPEGEACGDDTNGGCNSEPPAFGAVTCGEHICGEVWADGGTRDTDWFSYVPATDTFITWNVTGAVPLAIILIDYTAGCGDEEYVYLGGGGTPECDTASVTVFVQASHLIACFVSTDDTYSGYPCADGPFYYEAWLDCISPDRPDNDYCADAIEIGDVTNYPWTNIGASTDNNFDCDSALQADVWYRYTASCTGVATLDLCLPENQGFDTFVGVYTDDCVNGECIVWGDDDCGEGGGPSRVSWEVTENSTYLLCLGGWSGTMGTGVFNVSCTPPPTIDVQPTSVTGTANEGSSYSEMLTVSNTGGGDLYWEAYAYQDFPTTTAGHFDGSRELIKTKPAPLANNVTDQYNPREMVENFSNVIKDDSYTLKENIESVRPAQQIGNKVTPGLTTAFCEILMTGAPATALGGWFTGGEYYAQYQDPELFCPTPVYPYLIDNIQFSMMLTGSATTSQYLHYQFIVYDADLTDPNCPIPDSTILYVGPADSMLFDPGQHFYFPHNPALVVNGPYFVGVNFYVNYGTSNDWRLVVESNPPPDLCISYNDYGAGWDDLGNYFTDYGILSNLWRSSGNTPEVCDVECPVGGIAENEACGDSTNNGCNLGVPAFEALSCNTTVCGTAWATGGLRDTDWYTFTLTDTTYIQIDAEFEFPGACYLLDVPSCDSIGLYAGVEVGPCEPGTITGILLPGTYYLFAAPNVGENVYCDGTGLFGYEYYVTLQCMPAWLYVDTYGGQCPPDVDVNVTMSATYLTEGVYTGNIIFYSTDLDTPELTVPVTFNVTVQSGYAYYPGDANMAAGLWPPSVVGGDVTYLVNFFRGLVPDCKLDGFYASADINASCSITGSDVTRLVNYFRGMNGIDYCPNYEPLWHVPADFPPSEPGGWPNCQ